MLLANQNWGNILNELITNLMHDVHNNKVPSGILTIFQKTSSCHSYNRLRVIPHFSSGIVERAKRERA